MSDAFRLWASCYDAEPNPLLRLGDRVLAEALGDSSGLRVLDAGCGTGRWMRSAEGAQVVGLDFERAMLAAAPRGRVALADMGAPPLLPQSFDLVRAAFSLSHAKDPGAALGELCRLVKPGGRLAAADLSGEAVAAGWRRTFVYQGETIEIPSRVAELETALAAAPAGWSVERAKAFAFGEPERTSIGAERWRKIAGTPAVRITIWRRR